MGDKDYAVTFVPGTVSSADVAKQFCVEQGGNFGITAATLQDCIGPVSRYIQDVVDKSAHVAADKNPVAAEKQYVTYTVSDWQLCMWMLFAMSMTVILRTDQDEDERH